MPEKGLELRHADYDCERVWLQRCRFTGWGTRMGTQVGDQRGRIATQVNITLIAPETWRREA